MASFLNTVRQGFGRQANKGSNQPNKYAGNQPSSHSPTQPFTIPPFLPPQQTSSDPNSPSLSTPAPMDPSAVPDSHPPIVRKPPFFFRDEYAILIVKGNFMTLAAKPVHVEEGEWLAHQVVEQYRLLDGMIQIIKTIDDRIGLPICNQQSCPTMSAAGHTYTWLDSNKNPIRIPAYQYINLVQKWIVGKISDASLFPTDTSTYGTAPVAPGLPATAPGASTPLAVGPTTQNVPLSALTGRDWLGKASGFPENFESDIRNIYRQMMRCYAHLYHGHWLEPFWHLNSYKELNTCFIHFVNVGKLFGLLATKEMEPMMPLIDLWMEKGLLPNDRQTHAVQQGIGIAAVSGTASPSAPAATSGIGGTSGVAEGGGGGGAGGGDGGDGGHRTEDLSTQQAGSDEQPGLAG